MTYKDPSAIVKMFGPSISDPSKIVNRDVHQRDVEAYKAAGYREGSIPEPEIENYIEEVTPEVDDLAVVEAPKPEAPKRKKK